MNCENLEKNRFYNKLLTQHLSLFLRAADTCALICVPQNRSLANVSIDESFIHSHILKQSPLLKNHHIPLINSKSCQLEDVELNIQSKCLNVSLRANPQTFQIRIISEEDAYNSKNKLYKILIVERPLNIQTSSDLNREESQDKSIVTVKECREYLDSFSVRIVEEIEREVINLKLEGQISQGNLNEISDRVDQIISSGIQKMHAESALCDEVLEYAVESLVTDLVYDELMAAIEEHTRVETSQIEQKMQEIMKNRLDMKSLGSEIDFESCHVIARVRNGLLEFKSKARSPFEKLVGMKDFLSGIRESIERSIEARRNPFDSSPANVCLLPDDLIAATVFTMVTMNAITLVSNLRYTQMFGRHLPATNEMAYSLVTIEAALEFIKNFDDQQTPELKSRNDSPVHEMKATSSSDPKKSGRDMRFNRKLGRISKLVDTVLEPEEEAAHEAADLDDLGDFLSDLKLNKYQVNFGQQK